MQIARKLGEIVSLNNLIYHHRHETVNTHLHSENSRAETACVSENGHRKHSNPDGDSDIETRLNLKCNSTREYLNKYCFT